MFKLSQVHYIWEYFTTFYTGSGSCSSREHNVSKIGVVWRDSYIFCQLQILYDEAERTWENSGDDVKKVYGKNYTRSIIDALLDSHDTLSSRNVDPVTDAIEDCLVSSNPAYRTVVHGGPYKVDAFAVC